MFKDLFRQTVTDCPVWVEKDKKVEYLELIYDLIFVYVIGRNNALLHYLKDGFVDPGMFAAYVLCTLAVIQIWNYSAYYINLYGDNGIRDHIFLLINMFLLYFIAEATHRDWEAFQNQYHIAWALILINIGIQYLIEYMRHPDEPADRARISRMVFILFVQAALIFADIPLFNRTGTTWLSAAAIAFGLLAVLFVGQRGCPAQVDFAHLSERAMLYVVFTFGEMIIVTADYFEGDFTLRSLYFSLMAFLIVVGLFLTYETLYDHLIDRDRRTNGLGYMAVHILIIFALNSITTALEFMRNEHVDLKAKTALIIISLIMYYAGLLMLGAYAGKESRPALRSLAGMISFSAVFVVLMILLMGHMVQGIAVTVLYIFAVWLAIRRYKPAK